MRRLPFLVGALLLSSSALAAVPFFDVPADENAANIELLYAHGIVNGYPDGSFRPDWPMNRAEFLKVVTLAAFGEAPQTGAIYRCFADFTGDEQWYWTYACRAKEKGLITGYPDGTFLGAKFVTMAEALKMSFAAWEIVLPNYVREPDNWYDPYMDTASYMDVFAELPQVPSHVMSRSEVAALLLSLDRPIKTVAGSPGSDDIPSLELTEAPLCGNGIEEEDEECDDGNVENGDGCSERCLVVVEPVRHAALKIEQRPTPTSGSAAGSIGLPLITLDATAGRQDVSLTGLIFAAEAGDLADGQNYRILTDRDGDGVFEKVVALGKVAGEEVVFSGFAVAVPDGVTIPLQVRADLRSNVTESELALRFATENPRYAEAVGALDSRDLTGIQTDDEECTENFCWIAVVTIDPQTIAISGVGNLYVTADTQPIPSRILLLGTKTDAILGMRFRAAQEDIIVTSIALSGGTNSVALIELFQKGDPRTIAVLRTTACETPTAGLFCAQSRDGVFTVAKDTEAVLFARIVLLADTDGGRSGENITLALSPVTGTSNAIEARGKLSGKRLLQNNGNAAENGEVFIGRKTAGANLIVTGSENDVAAALIISIENTNPDPDGTPVPAGTAPIAQFRFSVGDNISDGGATVRKLVFDVSAVNVQIPVGSYALYNTLDASVTHPCTGNMTTGSITVTCSGLGSSGISTAIDAGGFTDLALKARPVYPEEPSAMTLQVGLSPLSDRTRPGVVEWHDGEGDFSWVDIGIPQVRSTLYRTP
ncbi:MAG: S-layer homology domain-containing protein [Candidatus Peregrinibacteria bacterium]|nr:S-layer homology domain-containing protein [Candidatus Peregrinibacteria bacterium]